MKGVSVEEPSAVEVTRLLNDWGKGDQTALERLTPIVYAELYRIARLNMAHERTGHVLQPSALVNEAFVRLLGGQPVEFANRAHFFGFSAGLMRRILIDFARAQDAAKRGQGKPHLDLSAVELQLGNQMHLVDFLDLDAALTELAGLDERQARVVELRYFGGLENLEVAQALNISEPTVVRDWRVARAWLFKRLRA
jgi:RNA polymerase sigma factor (TIGR02999 family)